MAKRTDKKVLDKMAERSIRKQKASDDVILTQLEIRIISRSLSQVEILKARMNELNQHVMELVAVSIGRAGKNPDNYQFDPRTMRIMPKFVPKVEPPVESVEKSSVEGRNEH